MRRLWVVVILSVVLITCAGGVIVALMTLGNNDRPSFQEYGQDTLAIFNDEYDIAFQQREPWTQEPRNIALYHTCGEECSGEESVAVSIPGPERAIVFVQDHNVMDDSIKAISQRYEFVQQGSRWTLEWAGWKQQCRRDEWTAIFQGRFSWHTQPCL